MTINSLPPALVFVAGAVLLLLLPRRVRSTWFLITALAAFALLFRLQAGDSLTVPFLDHQLMPLRVDRLSLAFGYVFAIMAFLGGIYGFHLKDSGQQVAALLYAGGALGVVFAGDLFSLFVFWEIMTAGSVWLIWARRTPQSLGAGMRYLIMHLFGSAALLAGIMLQYSGTGSIAFNHLEGGTASYLILLGFAVNAAIPPLHAWLSDAYPEGTVTGSVFLSAFTTKVAVYTLARGFAGMEVLIWAGVMMAIYGVIFALLENDIRRLLAYEIISQVGYMVAAIGLGTEMAINGATAHAFAHVLYKGLLFMGCGTVLYATGRSKLTELGGLARAMPLALGLYMVGALSISGVPLLSGFFSKSMVVSAAQASNAGLVALLLNVASVGTFVLAGLRLPYFTWFGPDRGLKPAAVPKNMYLAMALTAAICLAIGVYPALLYNLLPFAVDYQPYTAPHVLEALEFVVFAGLGFWLLKGKLGGRATITLDTDWFYRRPARLAYRVFVVAISLAFAAADRLTVRLARFVVKFSDNPYGYIIMAQRFATHAFFGNTRLIREPSYFKPSRYRITLGVMVLLVLLVFIVLFIVQIYHVGLR
ncbi:MAG: Na(+)/H(+) antiporter subunit D [Chloroflexota bacterium]